MKFIWRLIFLFGTNAIALWVAQRFVTGFSLPSDIKTFAYVVAVFTLINFFIKPILHAVLSPVVVLTLGLGIIIINALVLFILDWLMVSVTIAGLYPLLYATLIIGAINIVLHVAARHAYTS